MKGKCSVTYWWLVFLKSKCIYILSDKLLGMNSFEMYTTGFASYFELCLQTEVMDKSSIPVAEGWESLLPLGHAIGWKFFLVATMYLKRLTEVAP